MMGRQSGQLSIRCKGILVSAVNETLSVSNNQGTGAEFLAAVVTLRSTEDMSALEAISTGV